MRPLIVSWSTREVSAGSWVSFEFLRGLCLFFGGFFWELLLLFPRLTLPVVSWDEEGDFVFFFGCVEVVRSLKMKRKEKR
jgi:hypothetical protein